jgi:cytochrome c556
MRRSIAVPVFAVVSSLAIATVLSAAEKERPPGPIKDRYDLMKGIGKNAKIIGDALKAGNSEGIADAAAHIQTAAGKALPLFPPNSTDPSSRAKPDIWAHWEKFKSDMKDLEVRAGELGEAVNSGGNVAAAAQQMFDACKNCHDQFRKPEKK